MESYYCHACDAHVSPVTEVSYNVVYIFFKPAMPSQWPTCHMRPSQKFRAAQFRVSL